MINVVSFSGGRTSAHLVYLMEQMRKSQGLAVDYIFMDTGAEHPETYRFINNVVNHWGIDLTCLRPVFNPIKGVGITYKVVDLSECKPDLQPWRDMLSVSGVPTFAAPRCTNHMKTIPHDKYCDEKYGKHNYLTWLGMRVDEPNRLKNIDQQFDAFSKKKNPHRNLRYLAHISDITKKGVIDWWKSQPFDLGIDEHLGNCVFCLKKGANKLALAARDEPAMATDFKSIFNEPSVRRLPKQVLPNEVIYRGYQSLESIEGSFADVDRDDICGFIRRAKHLNSGSCSESCEIHSTDQLDFFSDEK